MTSDQQYEMQITSQSTTPRGMIDRLNLVQYLRRHYERFWYGNRLNPKCLPWFPMMTATFFAFFACVFTLTLASSIIPFPGHSCATLFCLHGTCVETPKGPKCVSSVPTPGPYGGCRTLPCRIGYKCIETPIGPECVKETGCDAVFCRIGTFCVETSTGPKCVPQDTCVCTEEFNPVCCKFATGETRTAENPCKCNGCDTSNKIISRGSCPPSSCALIDCAPGFKCVEKNGEAKCVRKPSCVCTREYRPVCCKTKSGLVTKPNPCTCTCLPGARIVSKGKCLKILPLPRPDCICPAVYDPVCCKSPFGGVWKASNSCECGCQGGRVVAYGCGIYE